MVAQPVQVPADATAIYNVTMERDTSDDGVVLEPATTGQWPPVAGAFVLGSIDSPVAVCTLATQSLLAQLNGRPEIAIAGRVYTENIGIEKMVQNLLAGPHLRYLIVCGRESRHRVGQAILSLHRNGVDTTTRRILGATGPEPLLINLSLDEIEMFRERVQVIDLIGEQDVERILEEARAHPSGRARLAAPPNSAVAEPPKAIQAERDPSTAWNFDPLGFFLIQVHRERGLLLLEHYDRDRRLRHRLEGSSAAALSQTAIRLGLVSVLAHAAYLGRELAFAETALRTGAEYQQDSRPRFS
jgi:tetrahydromethanopterin S-methyltransferase subunit A